MILLSLASKQIWPQLLVVAELKPDRVFLLHSEDAAESKGPAQRLKRLFDETGLVAKGRTRLELISASDFTAIERRLDDLQITHQLPLGECVVNFTGGNKLMATASFRWAAKRGATAFYLERRNWLTWFEPRDGEMVTRSEQFDGHVTDGLDPIALLRCQLDASEVERPGQAIVLNEAGRKTNETEFFERIQNGQHAVPWLSIMGEADHDTKSGDALEFAAAAVFLKLGVKRVQRSLRLKVKSAQQTGTRLPHAEIDLLFTWAGRLWLVDCKDRMLAEDLADRLRRRLHHRLDPDAEDLLTRIERELSIGQTKESSRKGHISTIDYWRMLTVASSVGQAKPRTFSPKPERLSRNPNLQSKNKQRDGPSGHRAHRRGGMVRREAAEQALLPVSAVSPIWTTSASVPPLR